MKKWLKIVFVASLGLTFVFSNVSELSFVPQEVQAATKSTFKYRGVTLSKVKTKTYSVLVVKTFGKKIGYAKPSQMVYVTGSGKAKVYWFSTRYMPKNTNKKKIVKMTIKKATTKTKTLPSGRKLSYTEKA